MSELRARRGFDMDDTGLIINLPDPSNDQDAATKKYVDDNIGAPPGSNELDRATRTSNLSVTATAAGSADTVIDGNAVSYDGSEVLIEFGCFAADVTQASGFNGLVIELFDGATDLGILCEVGCTSDYVASPLYGRYFYTPSAGTHTFHIKAWKGNSGAANIFAGSGGAATGLPAWYRVTAA